MTPWPGTPPTAAQRAAYADAEPRPYWIADLAAPDPAPTLVGLAETDLCIVGGGFTGLWAALHAKADDPGRDVVVLEGETCGFGASGRNGGFAQYSLTHGLENGLSRFPHEARELERLGRENHAGLIADVARLGIDCELERTGDLVALLDARQHDELEQSAALHRRFGHDVELLDESAMRAEVISPIYRGGLWDRTGSALVHPGKLALGLRAAALAAGVRLYEHSAASDLRELPGGSELTTAQGRVRARRVLLATSAFPPLLRALRHYIAPVYDYALVTEPLAAAERASIGWQRRQGIGDWANQFHYYRLTADDRILFGGFDAIYRFGGPLAPRLDDRDATFARLSQHFSTTFPQLAHVRFTHRWGGAIDTCSRFCVFFGTAHGGRVSYATGYTGLGVSASRFGARVALDLVDGRETAATRLDFVRRKPVPYPPEPLRSLGIRLTIDRLAAADRNGGRRGLWLRTLDRLGLGFDS
ncbi:MAG TPA: FAD-binding oxidoreductase [Gaiellales bacterium]